MKITSVRSLLSFSALFLAITILAGNAFPQFSQVDPAFQPVPSKAPVAPPAGSSKGQLLQPDGRPTKDVAKTNSRLINGLSVTSFDATGTYVAEVTPGSAERFNKPGFRMRAAVIQTAGGPYFIKLIGPLKSVTRWDKEYEAFLQSLQYK